MDIFSDHDYVMCTRRWFIFLFPDDRFCQYNIKEIVYDVRSIYQHILICDTVDTGKLLVLDGLANLGEADTVGYTHAVMDLSKVTTQHSWYI